MDIGKDFFIFSKGFEVNLGADPRLLLRDLLPGLQSGPGGEEPAGRGPCGTESVAQLCYFLHQIWCDSVDFSLVL